MLSLMHNRNTARLAGCCSNDNIAAITVRQALSVMKKAQFQKNWQC
jgi:hypothetical protein